MVLKSLQKAAEYPYEKIKIELTREEITKLIRNGFWSGIGWATGVTIGFALVSTIIVLVFNRLGGLPIIGGFVAEIVQETTLQLSNRTILQTPQLHLTPTPNVLE